jgi:hypothetical protein
VTGRAALPASAECPLLQVPADCFGSNSALEQRSRSKHPKWSIGRPSDSSNLPTPHRIQQPLRSFPGWLLLQTLPTTHEGCPERDVERVENVIATKLMFQRFQRAHSHLVIATNERSFASFENPISVPAPLPASDSLQATAWARPSDTRKTCPSIIDTARSGVNVNS